ncbi:MAG: metallophosphoesterase [Promethearchaeota archaeon]
MVSNSSENIDQEYKQLIVNKLVNSGINITPNILDFLLKLEDPLNKVNFLIKETSFLPQFNGHITKNVLKKISDEEIKKELKRILIRKERQIIDDLIEQPTIPVLKAYKHSESKKEKKKSENRPPEVTSEDNVNQMIENHPIKGEKKSKLKEPKQTLRRTFGTTKSAFSFHPIAKDYNTEFKILKDPTGKIYTNGDYNDFYELTLDKYNKLFNLMRKRGGETASAYNINRIYRISDKAEVSIIGLVQEVRETKNGHYLVTLEDLTGTISVLLRKDAEDIESLAYIKRTTEDQMLFVKGMYNPGEKKNKGIIFANYIIKIDIEKTYQPSKTPDPLSIALLSDTHIGSKEFEFKLWKRFIKFINGKLGNDIQRKIAGSVKYIIINGDLVDGVGVYPSQKEDLIETDIYGQFKIAAELLSEIPNYIKIFYTSGNHDPVRNAVPRPAVPKKYAEELINLGVKCVGNPCLIETHNVKTLAFHGDSILDMTLSLQDLDTNKPHEIMEEFLKCRHLAPIYGKKTQIAPIATDHLVIDTVPDIFHTGHVHINGLGYYNQIALVNSGTFQSQTEFMQSFGIEPTPGRVPIIELDTLNSRVLDFNIIK